MTYLVMPNKLRCGFTYLSGRITGENETDQTLG